MGWGTPSNLIHMVEAGVRTLLEERNDKKIWLSVIGGLDYWNRLLEFDPFFSFFFPLANSIH